MASPNLSAPAGYRFETLAFGEAEPAWIGSLVERGLWDATKTTSRLRRIFSESGEDPAKAAGLAFAMAIDARDGSPAGLFCLEKIEPLDQPGWILKNPFKLHSPPASVLDKSFRLRSWFMAYTLPGHRGRGLAAWGARLCEALDLAEHPPAPGQIPLVRAVEGAHGAFERGAIGSYACQRKPQSVNFPSEIHQLTLRFIDETIDGPVFGRADLSSYQLSDVSKPAPRAKAKAKAKP